MMASPYQFATSKEDSDEHDLHQLIEMGCWLEVKEFLKKEDIANLVSVPYPHRDGDFPLHAVCDFRFDDINHQAAKNKGVEVRQDVGFPPPHDVVLGILNAFPNATKVKGARGCLPLHNATRRGAPKEVMDALIRAFPPALDVKNDDNITPRDYIQTEQECNILLERPTICWSQNLADEKKDRILDEEMDQLEKEAHEMEQLLLETLNKEQKLQDRLIKMEMKLMRHDLFSNGNTLSNDIDNVCDELTNEIEILSENMLLVKENFETKYRENGKNRSFINDFNIDVMKIHDHLDSEVSDFRMELDSIKKMLRQ